MMTRTLATVVFIAVTTPANGLAGSDFLVPDQTSKADEFAVVIERQFTNDFEARLIKQAESAYGDVADPQHPEKSPDPLTKRWWCDEFDGVRILCAVTEDSVRYYLDLLKSFRKGDFSRAKGFNYYRASLKYHASVKYHQTFRVEEHQFVDVYVVSLNLSWAATCGSLCGHYPEKNRLVIFDSKGQLLLIQGDGWETFWVSEVAPSIRPNPALQAPGPTAARA